MGIDANSSGGHAIPPNLPRASSLGNFQSKWSKISSFARTNEEVH